MLIKKVCNQSYPKKYKEIYFVDSYDYYTEEVQTNLLDETLELFRSQLLRIYQV